MRLKIQPTIRKKKNNFSSFSSFFLLLFLCIAIGILWRKVYIAKVIYTYTHTHLYEGFYFVVVDFRIEFIMHCRQILKKLCLYKILYATGHSRLTTFLCIRFTYLLQLFFWYIPPFFVFTTMMMIMMVTKYYYASVILKAILTSICTSITKSVSMYLCTYII